jgi:hypothetical protein
MTAAAGHDEVRAAAALVAIAATGSQLLPAAVLGADPDTDRCAGIAWVLAGWLARMLSETGTEPRAFARHVIAGSVRDEAEAGAGP